MSRPKDPDTQYRMKLFVSNKHRYAATAAPGYNENGKWVPNTTIWGKLSEDSVFEPNLRFMMLTAEEKKKYIFPEDWDTSAASRTPSTEDVGGDVYTGEEDQYATTPYFLVCTSFRFSMDFFTNRNAILFPYCIISY